MRGRMKEAHKFDTISDCQQCGWQQCGWHWRECHVVPSHGLAKGSSIRESCYKFNVHNKDRWDDYLRYGAT